MELPQNLGNENASEFQSLRHRLLEAFPKEANKGLNLERVEKFILDEGLTLGSYVVVNYEDLPKLRKIDGGLNIINDFGYPRFHGRYFPEFDLVIVVRSKRFEKSNGSVRTESILVHELAHASCRRDAFVTGSGKGIGNRLGFCILDNSIDWGWFIEEGWAEMIEGKYTEKFSQDQDRREIMRILGLPNLKIDDVLAHPYKRGKLLPLPLKYISSGYTNGNFYVGMSETSWAAYGLELLIKKNPRILPLLYEARKNIAGLRALAGEFNAIYPGLYSLLQKSDYNEVDFKTKLEFIINHVVGPVTYSLKSESGWKKFWKDFTL